MDEPPTKAMAEKPGEADPSDVRHTLASPARPSASDAVALVPLPRSGQWVAAPLLLAATGRCSCDDCCAELVRGSRPQLRAV